MFLKDKTHIKIKEQILEIEANFPVQNWCVNGIYVWPYIRIKLYFLLLTNSNNTDTTKPKRSLKNEKIKIGKFKLLKKIIKAYIKNELFFWGLKRKKIIFFGSHIHRVLHEKEHFNRFFDAMVSHHELENEVYMIEHQKVHEFNFNNQAIIPLQRLLENYKPLAKIKAKFFAKKDLVILPDYELFIAFLNQEIANSKSLSVTKNDLIVWTKKIKMIGRFYNRLFLKVKPLKIMFPGYYGWDNLYAAVYAANKLNILTIDFQHGLQTNVHMVFSSWLNIPKSGYEIMPTEYWTWDEISKKNIEMWSKNTKRGSVKTVGQPYLQYWLGKNRGVNTENKIILYTLQLMPLGVMINENLATAINNFENLWKIRLHPRNEFSLDELKHHMANLGVDSNKFSVHDSKMEPLPKILSETFLHVTGFSGALIEAKMMGVPTVIVNTVGEEIYKDYIDNDLVFVINQNSSNFSVDFLALYNKVKNKKYVAENLNIVNPILE